MQKKLYVDATPARERLRRVVWEFTYAVLFRPTPRFILRKWRLFLLRAFGAQIGPGCKVAPSCFVWAPWNLEMGAYACLGDEVDCYSMAKITLRDHATVSQRAFLCAGSHEISKLERPIFQKPITIEEHAWVCAEAFIAPGIRIGEGAIVGARAAVFRDVEKWSVVGGNPARKISDRKIV